LFLLSLFSVWFIHFFHSRVCVFLTLHLSNILNVLNFLRFPFRKILELQTVFFVFKLIWPSLPGKLILKVGWRTWILNLRLFTFSNSFSVFEQSDFILWVNFSLKSIEHNWCNNRSRFAAQKFKSHLQICSLM
jgi:hypothetical protein